MAAEGAVRVLSDGNISESSIATMQQLKKKKKNTNKATSKRIHEQRVLSSQSAESENYFQAMSSVPAALSPQQLC